MTEIVRVLHILEYTGTREAVKNTLSYGAVPANGQLGNPNWVCVRSAILGLYPEVLSQEPTAEEKPHE